MSTNFDMFEGRSFTHLSAIVDLPVSSIHLCDEEYSANRCKPVRCYFRLTGRYQRVHG
jgi:hypothetical protein